MLIDDFRGATVRVVTISGAASGRLEGELLAGDAGGVMLRMKEGRVFIPWRHVLAVGELRDNVPSGDDLRGLWGGDEV